MNQNFYSFSDFGSKFFIFVNFRIEFPHSVSTWIKIFPTHQILMKKLFLERQSCCKNSISKILYLVNFHRKNVIVSFFLHSCKSSSGKKFFLLIKIFSIKIFLKKSVLNHFLYNASYSESIILNASQLEPFFTTRQFSNRNNWNVSDFEIKFYNESDFEVRLICF